MELQWREKMLAEKHHANMFQRIFSFFFDLFVLVITLMMVGSITAWWMIARSKAPGEDLAEIRAFILEHEFHLMLINWSILIFTAIFVHFIIPMMKRQTIGMKILGLYLRNEKAEEITKTEYLKRELYKLALFPTILLMLGKDKRPMYDKKTNIFLLS